jgi:nitronate monooxygenase/enoyl-[acyl-carrier protein] reductase II
MRDMIDRLNTKYPIWNAGMGSGIAGPELASAVSEAGGLGVLGCGAMQGADVAAMITDTKVLTKKSIGANIILPMSDGSDIAACFDGGVDVLVLFWDDIQPFVKDAQSRGIFILSQCGSPEDAVRAADAGADGIIIQGLESGGHVSSSQELVQNLENIIKDVKPLPCIAAGGLSTGAQIKDVLSRGARAVSLGTRFLATHEANATDAYKNRLLTSKSEDTVITQLFDGGWPNAPHRVIINGDYTAWVEGDSPDSPNRPGEGECIGHIAQTDGQEIKLSRYTTMPAIKGFNGSIENLPLYAGTSIDNINAIESVENLFKILVTDIAKADK